MKQNAKKQNEERARQLLLEKKKKEAEEEKERKRLEKEQAKLDKPQDLLESSLFCFVLFCFGSFIIIIRILDFKMKKRKKEGKFFNKKINQRKTTKRA